MVATAVMFALVFVATVTDLRQHRIYNWTTYPGIAIAIGLSGLSDSLGSRTLAEIGIGQSLLGLLVCGALMLVCFVLFEIGGGDVKLLAMTGAFLGPEFGIQVLLWTFVLGGLAAVAILIRKLGALNFAFKILQPVMGKFRTGWAESFDEYDRKEMKMKLYLAPCALAALLIVTVW
jgi:Flp pilus assembly protein protease CpaA